MPCLCSLLIGIGSAFLDEESFDEVVRAYLALDHQAALLLELGVEPADHLVSVALRGVKALATSSAPIICILILISCL